MRSSLCVLRPRVKLAFGEKRPVTVRKKKRAKHDHWAAGNAIYTPGKNSPLFSMVEATRALPREWWEKQHREAPGVMRVSPEEMAEVQANEKERERQQAERLAKKQANRAAVLERAKMLEQLDKDKADLIAAYLEQQQAIQKKKRSKYID